EPAGSFLCYNSTASAAGLFKLLYDAGGAGLQVDLSLALGIRVDLSDVDSAAPPYAVTVTLTDTSANSASFTRTVSNTDPRQLRFPFQGFPGVNRTSIFSIQVEIQPMNTDNPSCVGCGADFRVGRIEAFGPAGAALPLLSPRMLVASVAVL